MKKSRQELEKQCAEAEAKVEQYQHEGQRLENRIKYYQQGDRKKRNHRLITRGGAVESIVPEVRGMSERAFFVLMEQVFSLPEVAALVSRATDQQYGWSGNGGSFRSVGAKLLMWYDTLEMVEYLFGLGQLRQLGEPYSEEHTSDISRIEWNGMLYWVDPSEQQIFSKIAFVDYGYFYDADQTWYYVTPGPFHLKIPLTLIGANLDDRSFEFSFLRQVESLVLEEIFSECHAEHLERGGHDRAGLQKIQEDLAKEDYPLYQLCDRHKSLFDCFDDWVSAPVRFCNFSPGWECQKMAGKGV